MLGFCEIRGRGFVVGRERERELQGFNFFFFRQENCEGMNERKVCGGVQWGFWF